MQWIIIGLLIFITFDIVMLDIGLNRKISELQDTLAEIKKAVGR